MIRNVVFNSSPKAIKGAKLSRISFRLPMLILGVRNPCTGSKMHSAGRSPHRTRSISCDPNLTFLSRPFLSAQKSGVMILFMFAPARRSFLRSFFLMLLFSRHYIQSRYGMELPLFLERSSFCCYTKRKICS